MAPIIVTFSNESTYFSVKSFGEKFLPVRQFSKTSVFHSAIFACFYFETFKSFFQNCKKRRKSIGDQNRQFLDNILVQFNVAIHELGNSLRFNVMKVNCDVQRSALHSCISNRVSN